VIILTRVIHRDYLMRVIRQLVEAIARMLKLREAGDLEAALREGEAAYDLLGVPRELCDVADTPTLAGLLRRPELMRVAAKLFCEEAEIYERQRDPMAAFQRRRRALELTLEAHAVDPEEQDREVIRDLVRRVPQADLSPEYRARELGF